MYKDSILFLRVCLPAGLQHARDALNGDLPHSVLEAGQASLYFTHILTLPLDQLPQNLRSIDTRDSSGQLITFLYLIYQQLLY